ncbi:hypothetical protein BGZ94_001711, partial [Podila epigama]
MTSLLANNNTRDIIKAVIPISIGVASLAYLAVKLRSPSWDGFTRDKTIPTVRLRKGETAHDLEYRENPDGFLDFCEREYGPLFNVHLMNQQLTIVSHPYIKEIFSTKSFNSTDAIDEVTGIRMYSASVVKSNSQLDNMMMHEVLRDVLNPKLALFTERIAEHLDHAFAWTFGEGFETKLIEDAHGFMYYMVASSMAKVFMGTEIAQDPKVTESFIECTKDFGTLLQGGLRKKSLWHSLSVFTKYGSNNSLLNPLQRHVQALTAAATPVVLERRRQESECKANHVPYERPVDILQMLLDSSEKYGFVDLEDICGHILLAVLASVHSTSDACTNLLYYFAAYPQYSETLFQEQREVLDEQVQERERERAKLVARAKEENGEGGPDPSFEGTDLDPKRDRQITTATLKKLVHFDSYLRELFRYRSSRLNLAHKARETVILSNGQYISKGAKVIVNMRSAHRAPELGDDMNEFKPFRYLGQTAKSPLKPSTDMFFFGMGT